MTPADVPDHPPPGPHDQAELDRLTAIVDDADADPEDRADAASDRLALRTRLADQARTPEQQAADRAAFRRAARDEAVHRHRR